MDRIDIIKKQIDNFDTSKFKILSKKDLRKMSEEEVDEYYRNYRIYLYKTDGLVTDHDKHLKFHRLVQIGLPIMRKLEGRKLIINRDDRIYGDKPRIYCSTHVGRHDVETGIEAIGEQAYLVYGDPNETYFDFNGFLLDHNGRINLNTDRKYEIDRYIANETMIKHVEEGHNIYIYPEGAENIYGDHFKTNNYYDYPYMYEFDIIERYGFVLKNYSGAAKTAILTGADIVPMSIYRVKKDNYVVSFGKNLNFSGERIEDVEVLADVIRTAEINLQWENMKMYGVVLERSKINDVREASLEYTKDIMSSMPPRYTEYDIENTRFHEKEKTLDEWRKYNKRLDYFEKKYLK
ncbi:MAG: hypothetical protein IJI43_00885 [Bacilli bacterium]|nr:hypothetical protein [Bacilli bacterium]